MKNNFKVKISVFSGDIIYFLPGIKHLCERNGVKAEIYLWLNRPWKDSVQGQSHPYGVTECSLAMMKPLVESQPYIEFMREWKGEEAVDLDKLRTETLSTMPYGSITMWPGEIWPDMQGDTSKPWLNVNNLPYTVFDYLLRKDLNLTGKILINRTSRWRNDMIHYWFLREYPDQVIFTGLPEEHEAFCREWDLQIPLLKCHDFLELAIAIATCKYFIGNQSLCFAIAEAMKTPRLLEICRYAPNVIPSGKDAHFFLHQFALEWFVKDKESPFNLMKTN